MLAVALECPLNAQTGYGYLRGKDPLILGVKKIVLEARRGDWRAVEAEALKLAWQFKELREDLGLDLEKDFLDAARSKSMVPLSREITRLVYAAVVQKFHWNEKEELKLFGRSKSRVEAAAYYYQEILSLGVKRFDEKKDEKQDAAILEAFDAMRRSLGSPGLLGVNARPPDLEAFRRARGTVQNALKKVFPVVEEKAKEKSG